MTQEPFDTTEWEMLIDLPIVVFQLVAGVDTEVDSAEFATFVRHAQAHDGHGDPLLARLMESIGTQLRGDDEWLENRMKVADNRFGSGEVDSWLDAIGAILNRRLGEDGYHRFLTALVLLGEDIADASGSGHDIVSTTIRDGSYFERVALQLVVDALDIDLARGVRAGATVDPRQD